MLTTKEVYQKLKEYCHTHKLGEKLQLYVEAYVTSYMQDKITKDSVLPKIYLPVGAIYEESGLLYPTLAGDLSHDLSDNPLFSTALSAYVDLEDHLNENENYKFIIPIYNFQSDNAELNVLEETGYATCCENIDLSTFDDKEVLILRCTKII